MLIWFGFRSGMVPSPEYHLICGIYNHLCCQGTVQAGTPIRHVSNTSVKNTHLSLFITQAFKSFSVMESSLDFITVGPQNGFTTLLVESTTCFTEGLFP